MKSIKIWNKPMRKNKKFIYKKSFIYYKINYDYKYIFIFIINNFFL